jgi:hypothetical protein
MFRETRLAFPLERNAYFLCSKHQDEKHFLRNLFLCFCFGNPPFQTGPKEVWKKIKKYENFKCIFVSLNDFREKYCPLQIIDPIESYMFDINNVNIQGHLKLFKK